MQKVVLATGNAGKVRELASLLSDFGLDIVAQTDLGVDSAEETGLTFIENAILKARHAAKVTGLPAIADDSGLAVDVLGGAPGIYSARYSGEDATDLKNLQKLLETLKDVPDDQRQARFHCVLVYLRHAEDPTPLVCHGSWPGVITREPAGTGGFGYDPIFFVPSEGKTAAELTREEKSAISHRGQALKLLLDALRNGLITAAESLHSHPVVCAEMPVLRFQLSRVERRSAARRLRSASALRSGQRCGLRSGP